MLQLKITDGIINKALTAFSVWNFCIHPLFSVNIRVNGFLTTSEQAMLRPITNYAHLIQFVRQIHTVLHYRILLLYFLVLVGLSLKNIPFWLVTENSLWMSPKKNKPTAFYCHSVAVAGLSYCDEE